MSFREQIIERDNFQCRNPQCLSVAEKDWRARRFLSVHHIVYRSHQGGDTPENTITLCKLCDYAVHHGRGKRAKRLSGRKFMLKILDKLTPARDFRWHGVRKELEKRYRT